MKFIRALNEETTNRVVLSQEILDNLSYFDEFIESYKSFRAARRGNKRTASFIDGERLTVSANLSNYLHVILAADDGFGHDRKVNSTGEALAAAIKEIRSRPVSADPERAARSKAMQDREITDLYSEARFKQFIHVALLKSADQLVVWVKRNYPGINDPEGVVDDALSRYMEPTDKGGSALSALLKYDLQGGSTLMKWLSDGLVQAVRTQAKNYTDRSRGGFSLDTPFGGGDSDVPNAGEMIPSTGNPDPLSNDRIEVSRELISQFGKQKKLLEQSLQGIDPMSADYARTTKELNWVTENLGKKLRALSMLSDDLHSLYEERRSQPSPETEGKIQQTEAQFDKIRSELDTFTHAQENSTAKDEKRLETKDTSDYYAKRTQQQWLATNKHRQELGLAPLPWTAKSVPPDEAEIRAYGLEPEALPLTELQPRNAPGRPRTVVQDPESIARQRRLVDERTRQIIQTDMAQNTDDILPHAFSSWNYPNRGHLNPNAIWKPFPHLHNSVQTPEDIRALQSGILDPQATKPELQWSHLALKAGFQANNDFAFDRLNRVKGAEALPQEERTDNLNKWARFQKYIRDSDAYQANPDFFEAKLRGFFSNSELANGAKVPQDFSNSFGRQMDVYLRAAAYEKGRKEIGGDKPWDKLSPDELDAIAKNVWERLYQDGNRQFMSIRANDPLFRPTAPLNRATDPKELLKRMRAELHRISTKQKGGWVTTAIDDQLDTKSKDGTKKTNKALGKEVPKYNRGGEALQKIVINPNDQADHNLRFEHIPSRLFNEQPQAPVVTQPQAPSLQNLQPVELPEGVRHLGSYSLPQLTRMADIYDSIGMTDYADAIDEEIKRRANG